MRRYPPVPHLEAVADDLEGHLWLQEYLDGAHLRVQLRETGAIRFGDRTRTFDPDDVPPAYEHAVSHVRASLDRAALRGAVDDVESVVLFGEAMHRQVVDYDFDRTPSVLGFDVYDADRERFLPPDAVEHTFERLGLHAVNAIEKEVRAADFRPDRAAIPGSAWRDGPAAGLVVRDKTGTRGVLPNPDLDLEADPEPLEGSAEELAARYASDDRLARLSTGSDTFEGLYGRVVESVLREAHARLHHSRTAVDPSDFRSAVAARTRRWLAEEG